MAKKTLHEYWLATMVAGGVLIEMLKLVNKAQAKYDKAQAKYDKAKAEEEANNNDRE